MGITYRATPFGVASLICSKVLEVSNLGILFASLLTFIITVLIGVALYQFVIMQLIYFLVLNKNPFKFYLGVLPGAVTGFAADSSSVAMPVTLKCLDENVNVDPRIAHFVVPIGVTGKLSSILRMQGRCLILTITCSKYGWNCSLHQYSFHFHCTNECSELGSWRLRQHLVNKLKNYRMN